MRETKEKPAAIAAPFNKALHRTAIPLRSIAAGELGRSRDAARPANGRVEGRPFERIERRAQRASNNSFEGTSQFENETLGSNT